MAALEKYLLVQLIVLTLIITSHGSNTIFVRPLNHTECQVSSVPCLTLGQYLQQSKSSSTSMIFLDGCHELDVDFIMSDLVDVSLRADSNASVSIDCRGQTRFLFNNVSRLVIENISFTSCGISSIKIDDPLPGLSLYNLDQAELINVTITNSTSGALYIYGSNISITDLTIARNFITENSLFSGVAVENSTVYLHGHNYVYENGRSFIGYKSEKFPCTGKSKGTVYGSHIGAVFSAVSSYLIADGTLTVTNNTSPSGVMILQYSNMEMYGDISYSLNYVCALATLAYYDSYAVIAGEVLFSNNTASNETVNSVAGMSVYKSTLDIYGNVTFNGNTADYVSSIFANDSHISINGSGVNYSLLYPGATNNNDVSLELTNNRGQFAIFLLFGCTFLFSGTSHFANNPSTCMYAFLSNIALQGQTIFTHNSGAIQFFSSELKIRGQYLFDNNRFTFGGGALYLVNSQLDIAGDGTFANNRAVVGDGGAIFASRSSLIFKGIINFVNNTARNGGAVYGSLTQFQLRPPVVFTFDSNTANKGGGIYVVDIDSFDDCFVGIASTNPPCFLNFDPRANISFRFLNNSALEGGSALYGGRLDICFLPNKTNTGKGTPILFILESLSYVPPGNTLPIVSSDPQQFCFCGDGRPDCGLSSLSMNVRRGQSFSVSVTAFSQTRMSIQGTVRGYLESIMRDGIQSLDGELQYLNSNCTDLFYRVYSERNSEQLNIYADGLCRDIGNRVLTIQVTFEECPIGFELNVDKCVCGKIIDEFVDVCNVDNGMVTKSKDVWIGAPNGVLILDRFCPVDYCIPPPVEINLTNVSTQCINNRTGILCGKCKTNYSLVLGSTKCAECSDNSFLALLLVFAVVGILLVAFLFLLQMTISSGSIHGLILYANIISANLSLFTPPGSSLAIFIAWLNLDFGIETCFHDGLDQLQKAAWQFAFPLYLWLLVGIIIVISHYSIKFSKIFADSDPVAVLATIILLSYAKLLQNIIEIFSPGILIYPNNSYIYVWWYDGNVEFYTENTPALWYVLLVVAVVMLLFLCLPYTTVLFLAQLLQKSSFISNCFDRLRISPFIKAYHAPYKSHSRYWVGLCLLVRCIILAIGEAYEEVSVNLLVISTLCAALLTIIGASGGIYNKQILNVLELFFLFNLVLFSAATYHIQLAGGNQTAAVHFFISVAVITLIVIVIVHAVKRLKKHKWFLRAMNVITTKLQKKSEKRESKNRKDSGVEVRQRVTIQNVDLNSSYVSNQLRESMLESYAIH